MQYALLVYAPADETAPADRPMPEGLVTALQRP